MVKLAGTHSFDAPKSAVWEALLDPDVLSRILPGCKQLEKTSDNEFSSEINIRVGPVQGSFNGTVKLSDVDPPNGYQMEIAGQGRPGYVKGVCTLRLEGDGPTTLHYDGDAQLSGRIASVGQRLVDSTARSLTRQPKVCNRSKVSSPHVYSPRSRNLRRATLRRQQQTAQERLQKRAPPAVRARRLLRDGPLAQLHNRRSQHPRQWKWAST